MEANFINKVEYTDAGNADIIKVLEKNFPSAERQVREFSKRFEANTIEQVCQNVWEFMKENFIYKADGSDHQKIVLPARAMADRKTNGIDCKSFALFAASNIAACTGTEVGFRYSSYRNDPTPTHVYAIAKDEDGKTIIIDGVWNEFNSEKNFKHKKDHWMKISTLSGIPQGKEIPKIKVDEYTYHALKTWKNVLNSAPKGSKEYKMATAHIKELMQNIGLDKKSIERSQKMAGIGKHHWWQKYTDKVHSAFKGAWDGYKHLNPAFATMRNSFLMLLDINYRGLGSRITEQIAKDPTKIEHLWHKTFGGNFQKLKNAAARGAKHKPFFGRPKGIRGPEVVAGIIASAAAIIAAIVPLIPKGKPSEDAPETNPNLPGYNPKADPSSPEFDPVFAAQHPNAGAEPPPDVTTDTTKPLTLWQKVIRDGKEVIEAVAHVANPQDASGATTKPEDFTPPVKESGMGILPVLVVGGIATTYFLTKKK